MPSSALRRHPVLAALGLALLLAGGVLAYALATFDLDRYRGQLQERLSAALERPVRLGRAELTLRRGPAVTFAKVEVGKVGEESSLQADRLLARLDWRGLLRGRVAFSRIVLERPRMHLLLKPGEEEVPDLRDLESAEIRSLAVIGGVFTMEDRRRPERPFSAALEGIEAKVSGISAGRTAKVRVDARLRTGGAVSPLSLAGEVALPSSSSPGGARLRLGLVLERFAPAPLLAHALGGTSPLLGAGRLELTLEGSPASGLRIGTLLAGPGLKAQVPGRKVPIPLRELKGSGTWTATSAGHTVRDLSLRADELSLAGEFSVLTGGESPRLEARLTTPPLPVRTLVRLLPEGALPAEVTAGTLQVRSLRFSGPASALKEPSRWGEHLQGEGVLAALAGTVPRAGKVADASVVLRMKEDLLLLEGGRASLLGTSVSFDGAVAAPLGGAPELTLEAEGTLPAGEILARIPAERRRGLDLKGAVPAVLGLEAEKGRLRIDLRADLAPAALRWDGKFEKTAGRPGHLSLAGEITPTRMELGSARLELPPLELRARGGRDRGGRDRKAGGGFALTVDAEVGDLAAARPLSPPLAEVRAEGGIAARVELSGDGERLRRRGTVTLKSAGFRIIPELADIRQASGVLRLTDEVLESGRLTARLGTSPIAVEGRLAGFKSPRIELRVRARAIRADELIFTSPRAILRDVDGRLVIDGEHVAFAPVRVRLDGGTEAVVEGEVRDFDRPRVTLDVAADRADIDEVIALWEKPEGAKPSGEKDEESKVTVRVAARAAQGKLENLAFREAEGVVAWKKGVLSVYPLRFRAGGGRCSGRVLVEDAPGGRSLLTVSGHADGVDAAAIYRELLQRKGLVSGTLRGDFHLAGDPENFRKTARGGVSVVVERGVLRKFSSLAKVFSLLNVSQIFALQLPDMARDGMPFNRLSATFDIGGGVLRTEDLFVDSNAMNFSLVGSVDLTTERLDLLMGLKPLRTVDKIVTRIPLAGWLLTGDEKALITAHFRIKGSADDPEVSAVPITSLSEKAVGIFRRVLGLPGHVIDNVGEMVRGK